MKCKYCESDIHPKRIEILNKNKKELTCLNCSKEEKNVGICVNTTKENRTIQIVSKDVAN